MKLSYSGGINDTALLREFLDRHGSPAVILRCPPSLADGSNCPEPLMVVDLDCLLSPTDDLYSPPSPMTISDSPPLVLDPAFDPKLIYFNPSFSAWIRNAEFPEKSFKEWAEDSSMWHDIRTHRTARISYGHTTWLSYLIGGQWGVLQSSLHWSQMDYLKTPARESDKDLKRIKLRKNFIMDTAPLATPPLDTNEDMRPRKRRQASWAEKLSPASLSTWTPQHAHFPPQVPSVGSILARQGLLNDWTRYDIPTASEYIKFFRGYDWSKTAVGPMKDWSLSLRQNLSFLMSHPEARCIYFGHDDPIMFYNEACSKLLGNLHPAAMGVSGSVGAGSSWEFELKRINEVMQDGKAREQCKLYHPIPRGDLPLEEAYFSWWVLPVIDDSGYIFGVLKEINEVTHEVLAERRDKTERYARDSMKRIEIGDSLESYWAQVRNVIDSNPEDFPYCIMYSVARDLSPEQSEYPSVENIISGPLKQEGIVGLKDDHELAVDYLDVRSLGHPLAKQFRSAWITRTSVLLETSNDTLPISLRTAPSGRGLEGVCHSAILYPIRRIDGPGVVGFLLIGLNPQRSFDFPYRKFLRHIMNQFVKAAAIVLVAAEREKWK